MNDCVIIIRSYRFIPNTIELPHAERTLYGFSKEEAVQEYNKVLETRNLTERLTRDHPLARNEQIVDIRVVQSELCLSVCIHQILEWYNFNKEQTP